MEVIAWGRNFTLGIKRDISREALPWMHHEDGTQALHGDPYGGKITSN